MYSATHEGLPEEIIPSQVPVVTQGTEDIDMMQTEPQGDPAVSGSETLH